MGSGRANDAATCKWQHVISEEQCGSQLITYVIYLDVFNISKSVFICFSGGGNGNHSRNRQNILKTEWRPFCWNRRFGTFYATQIRWSCCNCDRRPVCVVLFLTMHSDTHEQYTQCLGRGPRHWNSCSHLTFCIVKINPFRDPFY